MGTELKVIFYVIKTKFTLVNEFRVIFKKSQDLKKKLFTYFFNVAKLASDLLSFIVSEHVWLSFFSRL